MSLCLRAALAAVMVTVACGAPPAFSGEFSDSAGRIVVIPDHPFRVMAATPTAQVLIYVLAPDKLAGWARLPNGPMPKVRRLSVVGPLTGDNPTIAALVVRRAHPDLIIDSATATPARAAFADQVSQASGVPYIIIDNSFDRTATVLRTVGRILGAPDRADDLAGSAEHAINALRGRLLIQSPTDRPRVYYARGPSGLATAEPGSGAAASIEAAGAINVAAALGNGQQVMVTPQQLHVWNPDIIITDNRGFYASVQRNPAWRYLAAVQHKKVFLEPETPFGWIDEPPSVNRLIGLYWLSELFYPSDSQDDLRSLMADFYDKFYGIKLTDAQIEAIAKTAGIPPSDTPHIAGLPPLGSEPSAVPGTNPGIPGAVNEPGRRGFVPSPEPPSTTPSYQMPR
jgi:iron complex transport system substrate-binding protein